MLQQGATAKGARVRQQRGSGGQDGGQLPPAGMRRGGAGGGGESDDEADTQRSVQPRAQAGGPTRAAALCAPAAGPATAAAPAAAPAAVVPTTPERERRGLRAHSQRKHAVAQQNGGKGAQRAGGSRWRVQAVHQGARKRRLQHVYRQFQRVEQPGGGGREDGSERRGKWPAGRRPALRPPTARSPPPPHRQPPHAPRRATYLLGGHEGIHATQTATRASNSAAAAGCGASRLAARTTTSLSAVAVREQRCRPRRRCARRWANSASIEGLGKRIACAQGYLVGRAGCVWGACRVVGEPRTVRAYNLAVGVPASSQLPSAWRNLQPALNASVGRCHCMPRTTCWA